jgi:predicted transcriptional regulator
MARRSSPILTDGEARLMKVIWQLRQASVADVVAAIGGDRVSYSTVQTMLRILENKGYVAHRKSGRAFIYRSVVDQKQARRKALRHLVARLFDNSPSLLVLNVLEDKQIDPREIERLRKLLEAQED